MTKIENTSCTRIPLRILADAGTWLLLFDSAFTTWAEATARVKELESEGYVAKYEKSMGQPHCVYKRAKGKGRRY